MKRPILVAVMVALFWALAPPAVRAATYEVLYSFKGGTDGLRPHYGVISDARGNLYGTTFAGGDLSAHYGNSPGCGTVYKLSPPAKSDKRWRKEILYRFTGTWDGCLPYGTLTLAPTGELYGTALLGGGYGCGTVFRLAPGKPNEPWVFQRLYEFTRTWDPETSTEIGPGCGPETGVVRDKAGILYGVARSGGRFNKGVIFRLIPSKDLDPPWDYSVLYHFGSVQDDGEYPNSPVILKPDGTLYGTTLFGGASDVGTVFQLSPPAKAKKPWPYKILHSFSGTPPDGAGPHGTLALGHNGELFTTASLRSPPDGWAVMQLLAAKSGSWKIRAISPVICAGYYCNSCSNYFCSHFVHPGNRLVSASSGHLFGFSANQLFKLVPVKGKVWRWKFQLLYEATRENSALEGRFITSAPFLGTDGYIYGTAEAGGLNDCSCGVVFRIKP